MNVVVPRYSDLGKASAEFDDEYFDNCFVDTGLIPRLLSDSSATSIIVGRIGSRKSALIRKIRERQTNVVQMNPEDLSLAYMADSWLLNFLTENDFDLGLFYQQLWRHVLVVELLKHHEGLDSESKSHHFLSRVVGMLRTIVARKRPWST